MLLFLISEKNGKKTKTQLIPRSYYNQFKESRSKTIEAAVSLLSRRVYSSEAGAGTGRWLPRRIRGEMELAYIPLPSWNVTELIEADDDVSIDKGQKVLPSTKVLRRAAMNALKLSEDISGLSGIDGISNTPENPLFESYTRASCRSRD